MHSRKSTMLLLAVALAGLALGKLEGGKPPKPPPAPVDGGVVYFNFGTDLYSMNPDGSGRKVILSGKRGTSPGIPATPLWSPAGTYIVFHRVRLYASVFRTTWDICRSTASGADEVLLTGDIDGGVSPTGWAAMP